MDNQGHIYIKNDHKFAHWDLQIGKIQSMFTKPSIYPQGRGVIAGQRCTNVWTKNDEKVFFQARQCVAMSSLIEKTIIL